MSAVLHTPTPWKQRVYFEKAPQASIDGPNDVPVCLVYWTHDGTWKANARRIVQCVNNFDALVAALSGLLDRAERELADPEDVPEIEYARTALSKATSQPSTT